MDAGNEKPFYSEYEQGQRTVKERDALWDSHVV